MKKLEEVLEGAFGPNRAAEFCLGCAWRDTEIEALRLKRRKEGERIKAILRNADEFLLAFGVDPYPPA